jgi:uncharacterized protein YkwD
MFSKKTNVANTPTSSLRRSRKATWLLAPFVIAASFVHSTSAAQADPVSDESRFVELINRDRAAAGLPALKVNVALQGMARAWATSMRDSSLAIGDCTISHNPNLGKFTDASWAKLGENVGGCWDNVDELHDAFMKSHNHYVNIMDPKFDSIAIGIAMDGSTIYVTENFMTVRAAPSAPSTTVPDALALKQPKVAGVQQVAAPAPTVKAVAKSPNGAPKGGKVRAPKRAAKKQKTATPATPAIPSA